jgi:serine/threonine protein kinase
MSHNNKAATLINELNIVDNQQQPTIDITLGMKLKNRFVIEELIATGGMGSIYKARDLRKEEAKDSNSHIAIKILGDEFRHHPKAFIALQRESRRIQNLSHPNIITVYDFDRDGDIVYMTMEYLHGTTLDKIIKNPTMQLSTERILSIARDIAKGLERAHQQGIIHSDLKPSNIFITHEGEVKLIDFGIARSAKRDDTLAGTATLFDAATLAAFTPAYASYEMIEGHAPDSRDDIYALSCILYELFTGKHPYQRMSAKVALEQKLKLKKPSNISNHIWKQLKRGLSLRAANRPYSAKAFVASFYKPKISWKLIASIVTPIIAATIFAGLFIHEVDRVHQITMMQYIQNNIN